MHVALPAIVFVAMWTLVIQKELFLAYVENRSQTWPRRRKLGILIVPPFVATGLILLAYAISGTLGVQVTGWIGSLIAYCALTVNLSFLFGGNDTNATGSKKSKKLK